MNRAVLGLRATIFALAALVLAWPLTTGAGLLAAIFGAVLGTVLGQRIGEGRLRLGPGLAAAATSLALGVVAARALTRSPLPAELLGTSAALALGELVLWAALIAPVAFGLRILASRRPTAAVLEVVAVGAAFASSLAAHRNGMVHRPHALGDWAWSRGFDPAWILLGLGALATLLLSAILIRERRPGRLVLHLATLALVALALLVLVRVEGLPTPDPAGDLGLTGDPEEERQDEGEGSRGRGREQGGRSDQLGDLEFKNEYGESGGEAPVAVVVLRDDWNPPAGVYYFRQSAFSQYNGRRLVLATRDDVDGDLVRRFPSQPLEVEVQPPRSGARRPLRTTTGLLVDHVRPFALDAPIRLAPVRNPDPMRFQRAFEATSRVRVVSYRDMIGHRPGDPDWTEAQWRHYTEAPSDPRYAELASEMIATLRPEYADDPLGQALAIKTWLDEKGIYSRKSRHADAGDPTASFLFGDLTGYCVHFAHAATYLLRSLDLPARVATGYAVPETSRGSGSAIMIRGLNAHAWPELYLEGLGWVVVDLAPQQSLEDPTQAADPSLQRMLGEMLRQPSEALDEPDLRRRVELADLLRWIARVLAALLVAAYAVKLWRRLAPGSRPRTSCPASGIGASSIGWPRSAGLGGSERAGRASPAGWPARFRPSAI